MAVENSTTNILKKQQQGYGKSWQYWPGTWSPRNRAAPPARYDQMPTETEQARPSGAQLGHGNALASMDTTVLQAVQKALTQAQPDRLPCQKNPGGKGEAHKTVGSIREGYETEVSQAAAAVPAGHAEARARRGDGQDSWLGRGPACDSDCQWSAEAWTCDDNAWPRCLGPTAARGHGSRRSRWLPGAGTGGTFFGPPSYDTSCPSPSGSSCGAGSASWAASAYGHDDRHETTGSTFVAAAPASCWTWTDDVAAYGRCCGATSGVPCTLPWEQYAQSGALPCLSNTLYAYTSRGNEADGAYQCRSCTNSCSRSSKTSSSAQERTFEGDNQAIAADGTSRWGFTWTEVRDQASCHAGYSNLALSGSASKCHGATGASRDWRAPWHGITCQHCGRRCRRAQYGFPWIRQSGVRSFQHAAPKKRLPGPYWAGRLVGMMDLPTFQLGCPLDPVGQCRSPGDLASVVFWSILEECIVHCFSLAVLYSPSTVLVSRCTFQSLLQFSFRILSGWVSRFKLRQFRDGTLSECLSALQARFPFSQQRAPNTCIGGSGTRAVVASQHFRVAKPYQDWFVIARFSSNRATSRRWCLAGPCLGETVRTALATSSSRRQHAPRLRSCACFPVPLQHPSGLWPHYIGGPPLFPAVFSMPQDCAPNTRIGGSGTRADPKLEKRLLGILVVICPPPDPRQCGFACQPTVSWASTHSFWRAAFAT